VTVDVGASQWLLLKATSTSPGDDGDRRTATTFIQRVATTGGPAPAAAACNMATAETQGEVSTALASCFWTIGAASADSNRSRRPAHAPLRRAMGGSRSKLS
jgi:hypothetical protein